MEKLYWCLNLNYMYEVYETLINWYAISFTGWNDWTGKYRICYTYLCSKNNKFALFIPIFCREENYGTFSVFFDLFGTGMKNLDLDYTKQIVHLLKYYYPNNLNFIFVYELPWILTGKYWHWSLILIVVDKANLLIFFRVCIRFILAAFNIIKALLPPKAVASLRFVNAKNLSEYISEENMLTCWGGKDDYHYKFEPSKIHANGLNDSINGQKGIIITKDENDNNMVMNHDKKVCNSFIDLFPQSYN